MTGEGDGASEVLLRFYFLGWVLGGGYRRCSFYYFSDCTYTSYIFFHIYVCVCIRMTRIYVNQNVVYKSEWDMKVHELLLWSEIGKCCPAWDEGVKGRFVLGFRFWLRNHGTCLMLTGMIQWRKGNWCFEGEKE